MAKIQPPTKIIIVTWTLILLFIIIIAGGWYGISRTSKLSSEISNLSEQLLALEYRLSSTTDQIREDVIKNSTTLSQAISAEKQNVGVLQQQLGVYKDQVGTISGTVSTLQKLSKTDPELLQKYSKVFFLNEHYSPPRLISIPNEYKYSDTKPLQIHTDVWPYLKRMVDDAAKNDIKIYVSSAFRSFNEQSALKGQYSVTYGSGTANQFSADQGYSEHQLGTTLDFTTTGINGGLDGFENTKAYTWLLANAYKYGFVLSYPKNNTYYVFEPWHWRYVGIKLATDLHDQGKFFYDLDQRKIDEYLVNVFE